MNHWMRTRTIRMIGVLFGLSLVLTACDDDVLALLDGSVADQGPAAEAAADDTAERPGDGAAEAARDDATAKDDALEGKSERREFQCRKDGVRKAAAPDAEDAAADAAPAKAPADADDAKDSGGADDGGDDGPAGSDDAPAGERSPAPEEPAPSGDDGDGSSGSHSTIERNIFDRLDATRREVGLAALTLRAEISRGARSWSCDMAASRNFRHADLRAAGVYGENIAWGQRSAAEVHEGWMNSSGHRENRMSSRWSEYGVGVCEDGGGHLYFTERFR